MLDFYAKLGGQQVDELLFRGCHVPITDNAMNSVYGLSSQSYPNGNRVIDKPKDQELEEAVEMICREGTKWKVSLQGKRDLFASECRDEHAVYLNFICNRLICTNHDTTVSQERIMLVYSMYKGLQINVGHLIRAELIASSKKKVGKLFFPSLVISLCK